MEDQSPPGAIDGRRTRVAIACMTNKEITNVDGRRLHPCMQDQEGRHLLPVGHHLLPACPFVFSHGRPKLRRRRGRRSSEIQTYAGSPRPPHTPLPNARRRQQCILPVFFLPLTVHDPTTSALILQFESYVEFCELFFAS